MSLHKTSGETDADRYSKLLLKVLNDVQVTCCSVRLFHARTLLGTKELNF
jgi:hypothetical protein